LAWLAGFEKKSQVQIKHPRGPFASEMSARIPCAIHPDFCGKGLEYGRPIEM
jgi:hypothetical protein